MQLSRPLGRSHPPPTIPHAYQLSRKMLGLPQLPYSSRSVRVGGWSLQQHKRGGALEPADDLKREIETLRNRLSGLSEAGVRITKDLDLDTVLQEVVDADRSLTGARISGLTALDEAGELMSFITSGMTTESASGSSVCRGAGVLRLPEQPSRTAQGLRLLRLHDGAGPTGDRPSPGAGATLSGCAHPPQGGDTSATSIYRTRRGSRVQPGG